jgi:hypothetical protein
VVIASEGTKPATIPGILPPTAPLPCQCFSREELEFCSITFNQLSSGSEFLNAFCPNPLNGQLDSIELTVDPDQGDTLVCVQREKDSGGVKTIFSWRANAPQNAENLKAHDQVKMCQKLICNVHQLNHPICKAKAAKN